MPTSPNQPLDTPPTRRVVLLGAAVTAVSGSTLAACGSGGSTAPASAPSSSGASSSESPSPTGDPSGTGSPSPTDGAMTQAAGGGTTSTTKAAAKPAGSTASHRSSTASTTHKASATASDPAKADPTTASRTTASKTTAAKTSKTTTKPDPAQDFSKGALASLSSIPVGGSAVIGGVVVARPSSGRVVGHSPICTHQGCTVLAAGRNLNCPCHGSVFDAFTGAVKNGPADRPLPGVPLVVKGTYVHRA